MVAWPAFALDSRSLALFRMAIGAILCADAILRTRDIAPMFSPDGMFPLDAMALFQPGPGIWSVATLVDAWWWGAAILAIEGAAGLMLALGRATTWATVVAWIAVVSVVRRTAPATNAGDYWLATLVLWSMFLPLGASWSLDAWRASGRGTGRPAVRVASAGSLALVLQIAAVYLSAGLAKCNESWWSGDAVAHALSVHDHGTRLGEALASLPWVARGLTWGTLGLEILGPITLVLVPLPAVRLALVLLFTIFHLAVCGTMTVGLFGYVGMAAWLAMIPPEAWEWAGLPAAQPAPAPAASRWGRWQGWACAACGAIAAADFLHDVTPWQRLPFPPPAQAAVNALCLHQQWGMFGQVNRQYQWVYSRAELADGRVVDVLRGGRPVEEVTPSGGFLSLPHHRWHKIFWEMPRPTHKVLAASVAAGLVRHWNDSHGPDSQVVALEIRMGLLGKTDDKILRDSIIAAWPPRDGTGAGNLDRWLREASRGELH